MLKQLLAVGLQQEAALFIEKVKKKPTSLQALLH